MLNEKLNELIATAMKNKENDKVSVLRLIKTEFVKKIKDGVELNEATEANILLKMMAQREDAIKQFTQANRLDLVENEQNELNILKEFAPKEASEEEIIAETERIISTMETVSMKDMKNILTEVQKKYPTANGKIVSQVVKAHC
ncbi:MAG: GatB/YqeY domain-containing protein [Bacilli bacterium]|nr:GatB/YqeY domain-containing protein [Bacilli bacterium]